LREDANKKKKKKKRKKNRNLPLSLEMIRANAATGDQLAIQQERSFSRSSLGNSTFAETLSCDFAGDSLAPRDKIGSRDTRYRIDRALFGAFEYRIYRNRLIVGGYRFLRGGSPARSRKRNNFDRSGRSERSGTERDARCTCWLAAARTSGFPLNCTSESTLPIKGRRYLRQPS